MLVTLVFKAMIIISGLSIDADERILGLAAFQPQDVEVDLPDGRGLLGGVIARNLIGLEKRFEAWQLAGSGSKSKSN